MDINKSNDIENISTNNSEYLDIPELKEKKNFFGKWASFFIQRYRVTFLLILIVSIWGISQFFSLQREAEPKVVLPMVVVTTSYTGASPDEMETLVTDKLEEKLEELEDIHEMSSSSGFGYSSVYIEFEPEVDIDEKIRDVREKLSNISNELPEDADTPVVTDLKTGTSPILIFSLSGNQDIYTLQNIAKNVKREIENVDGISEVGLVGDVEREITVLVDPQKLFVYNITLDDIKTSLSLSNVNFPGGDVELNNQIYSIRTVGRFDNVAELGNIIVKSTKNGQVYLKNVATIKDGFEDVDVLISKLQLMEDGQTAMKKAVVVAAKQKESADVIEVTNAVTKMIEDKKSELIPDTVKLELIGNKADYINDFLGSVTNNAKAGLFLVIAVLFLFIGFSESMVVSIAIPLSLLMTLGLMKIFGMTINNVAMFSMILAVGMLVDNAIVIIENVDRLRFKGLSSKDAAEVGTNQMAPAVFASTLTTLAAFFPIALTTGIMGDYIRPIPYTVIFALSSSFIIAITVIPSVCSVFLKKHRSESTKAKPSSKNNIRRIISIISVALFAMIAFGDFDNRLFPRLGLLSLISGVLFAAGMFLKQRNKDHERGFVIHKYSSFLEWIISKNIRKYAVIALVFIAFILNMGLIPSGLLKVELFASTDSQWLFVNINTPEGSTLDDTDAIVAQVEKKLLDVPEIKSFISYSGSSGANIWSDFEVDAGGDPSEAKIHIDLVDEKDRSRKSIEIAKSIRSSLKDIAGAEISVQELEDGPSSSSPIYIRVKGNNLDEIENISDDFADILNNIDGIRDVSTSKKRGKNELQVKVDKEKAQRFGLNDTTVASTIRNTVNGFKATTFRQDQNEFDIIIKTFNSELQTINDLDKIYFYNNSGNAISFSQVASIVESESINTIHHEDGKRLIAVSADIETGVNPKIKTPLDGENLFKEAIKDYPLPEDVVIEYGGESEMTGDSFGDMMVNMVLAIILVFIILSVQFNSLSQPFIIILTVPMSLIGVMSGLFITGKSFSFVAFVGVVALVGIAVNDAIVLVDYINYLRKNGSDMNDAIKETGMTRFLPVMATTITTAGGILPITLKDPLLAPMGVTLISGLCVTSMLTLLIVPTIYSIFEGSKLKRKSKKEAKHNQVQFTS